MSPLKVMKRPRKVYVWMAIMGWTVSASPILLFPFLGVGHVSASYGTGFNPAWSLLAFVLTLFVAVVRGLGLSLTLLLRNPTHRPRMLTWWGVAFGLGLLRRRRCPEPVDGWCRVDARHPA